MHLMSLVNALDVLLSTFAPRRLKFTLNRFLIPSNMHKIVEAKNSLPKNKKKNSGYLYKHTPTHPQTYTYNPGTMVMLHFEWDF